MAEARPCSPCINVCSLGPDGQCRGCLRTRDEIAGWIAMAPAEQWAVIRACDERRAARETLRRAAAAGA